MLGDITLGQYFPGKSILHYMDPRVKLVLLFIYIIALFVFDTYGCYAVATVFTVALVLLSKIPAGMVIRSLKPIMWLVIISFIMHIFSHDGEVIFQLGAFKATVEGIIKGFLISLRLLLLIIVSSLLMFTTSPLLLTDALEDLLKPLKKIGFPAHELAMMMTIAMRFIPTLLEETDKIRKAQQARGVDFESGNFINRAKQMVPILVPLFISAFRRADELAMAMEARCYHGGEGRTRMKKLMVGKLDYICITWFIFVIGALAGLKIMEI